MIIEGETGVGKTALVEMLSKLWNHSLLIQWKRQKSQLLDFMRCRLGDVSADASENYEVCHNKGPNNTSKFKTFLLQDCVSIVEDISAGKLVTEDDLILIAKLPDPNSSSQQFYTTLRTHLLSMQYDPVLSLLTLKAQGTEKSLDDLFSTCREVDTVEVCRPVCRGHLGEGRGGQQF